MFKSKIIKNAALSGRPTIIGGGSPASGDAPYGPWEINFTGDNEAHPNTAPITGGSGEVTYSTMGASDGEDPTNNGDAYKIYNNYLAVKDQSSNWQAVHWLMDDSHTYPNGFRIEAYIRPHIGGTQGMQGMFYGCPTNSYNPFAGDVMVFRGNQIRNYYPTTLDTPMTYNVSTFYTFRLDVTPTERKFYVDDVLKVTRGAPDPVQTLEGRRFGYMSWYTSARAINGPLCQWIRVTDLTPAS